MTATASVARFGRVQVEMLECIHQHRLLSTAQLHALYPGRALRRTQRALAAMERVGWLASVREPGGMKLWFVTEAGADAVEAVGGRAELRRKVLPPEQAAGPLQAHTLAVNEVGVSFVRAARERGDEFGPLAWRNEIAHPIGPPPGRRRAEMLIADAVLSYEEVEAESTRFHTVFLELDRTTMATESLTAKLGRYLRLHAYGGSGRRRDPLKPLWRESYAYFPSVTRPGAVPRFKRYLDEQRGKPLADVWTDIAPLNSQAAERLGYPTQKPERLLERIIAMSSNEGDVVLDPFCGCGTTIAVAQRLRREWIGVDISPTAVALMKRRMERFGITVGSDGLPMTPADLKLLDPHEFQNWIIGRVLGTHSPRKSRDGGIDGYSFLEQLPIQVRQRERVGRIDIDAFQTAVNRAGKHKGYFVAISFTRDLTQRLRAQSAKEGQGSPL